MSRVLLLEIGAAPLPSVTPVVPIAATWMPAVYVPPAPSVPGDLKATSIADAILLTWTLSDAYAPEYLIERAEDLNGVPGEWVQIGRTVDLHFTSPEPSGFGAWFRIRAVSLGRYSDYTLPVVQVPISSNPPVIDLEIIGGVITINCLYDQFYLYLNAHVNNVVYVNVDPAETILIEIEVAPPGGWTITWPASVQPVTGVPYVVSVRAGAVDLVGLTTNNGGIVWRMTYQQPEGGTGGGGGTGGAPSVTLAPSPASATVATDGITPTAPSVLVTATVEGGTGAITWAWMRADTAGGADFIVAGATTAAATFSVASGAGGYNATQQWRVVATDAATTPLSGQAVVPITLTRTAPVSATWGGATAGAAAFGTASAAARAWLEFGADGTWSLMRQTQSNGNWAAAKVSASGVWGTAPVGADYEVRLTPTLTSGTAGAVSNAAPAYVALGGNRRITIELGPRTFPGALSAVYSIVAELRRIDTPGTVHAGTVGISLDAEMG